MLEKSQNKSFIPAWEVHEMVEKPWQIVTFQRFYRFRFAESMQAEVVTIRDIFWISLTFQIPGRISWPMLLQIWYSSSMRKTTKVCVVFETREGDVVAR